MVGMMARVLGTIGEDAAAAANDDDADDEAAVEDDYDVAAEWGLQESTGKIPLKTKMIRRKSWASSW